MNITLKHQKPSFIHLANQFFKEHIYHIIAKNIAKDKLILYTAEIPKHTNLPPEAGGQ